jgi:hypothetical protein
MDWTSLALVPMKRLIIVFPFVAEKAFPARRFAALRGSLMPCIRKIVCRRRAVDQTPSLLCFSWRHVRPVLPMQARAPVAQQLYRGSRQTPIENTPQNVMWGPDPVKL